MGLAGADDAFVGITRGGGACDAVLWTMKVLPTKNTATTIIPRCKIARILKSVFGNIAKTASQSAKSLLRPHHNAMIADWIDRGEVRNGRITRPCASWKKLS